jgi:hypothetical protein
LFAGVGLLPFWWARWAAIYSPPEPTPTPAF